MKRDIVRRVVALECLIGLTGYVHGVMTWGNKLLAQANPPPPSAPYVTGTFAHPTNSTIVVPSPATAQAPNQTADPNVNATGQAGGNMNSATINQPNGGPITTGGISGTIPTTRGITGPGLSTGGITGPAPTTRGIAGVGHSTGGITGPTPTTGGIAGSAPTTRGIAGSAHTTTGISGPTPTTGGVVGTPNSAVQPITVPPINVAPINVAPINVAPIAPLQPNNAVGGTGNQTRTGAGQGNGNPPQP